MHVADTVRLLEHAVTYWNVSATISCVRSVVVIVHGDERIQLSRVPEPERWTGWRITGRQGDLSEHASLPGVLKQLRLMMDPAYVPGKALLGFAPAPIR